jgi:hypothetical protein
MLYWDRILYKERNSISVIKIWQMFSLNASISTPHLGRFERIFWRKMDVQEENSTFIN